VSLQPVKVFPRPVFPTVSIRVSVRLEDQTYQAVLDDTVAFEDMRDAENSLPLVRIGLAEGVPDLHASLVSVLRIDVVQQLERRDVVDVDVVAGHLRWIRRV